LGADRFIESMPLGAQEIAARDHADGFARLGGIDDNDPADIVADHFVGDVAERSVGIDRDWRAVDEIADEAVGGIRGIVQIAEGQNTEEVSIGIDDRISLMGPTGLA